MVVFDEMKSTRNDKAELSTCQMLFLCVNLNKKHHILKKWDEGS